MLLSIPEDLSPEAVAEVLVAMGVLEETEVQVVLGALEEPEVEVALEVLRFVLATKAVLGVADGARLGDNKLALAILEELEEMEELVVPEVPEVPEVLEVLEELVQDGL